MTDAKKVDPKDIKDWQIFEHSYLFPGSTEEEDEWRKELQVKIPSPYGNQLHTLRLKDGEKWEHHVEYLGMEARYEEEYHLVEDKQLRLLIQDGRLGFKMMDINERSNS